MRKIYKNIRVFLYSDRKLFDGASSKYFWMFRFQKVFFLSLIRHFFPRHKTIIFPLPPLPGPKIQVWSFLDATIQKLVSRSQLYFMNNFFSKHVFLVKLFQTFHGVSRNLGGRGQGL